MFTQDKKERNDANETRGVGGHFRRDRQRLADGLAEDSERQRRVDRLAEAVEEADGDGHLGAEHVREQEDDAALEILFLVQLALFAQSFFINAFKLSLYC